ncbi:MAG: kinase-like domain-containing protein [Benjaminiella poitrasii]|nr:MAG: kinase-like domain-containing protein [Benjaminiella poitrasii]
MLLEDNDPNKFLHTFIDNQSIELVSVIGTGTYGVVYLGRYIFSTNKFYAVKSLAATALAETEIQTHSILSGSHPNILALEKVVREQNRIFIVMEYATDGDLFSKILDLRHSTTNTLSSSSSVIRHLFLQIIDAVQHCHRSLVAHRDLKPENILLLSNYRVKLADFGLATTQVISNQFHCGSSYYFSPECQGIRLTSNGPVQFYDAFANDVWSLGVILLNLVSGRNPWKQACLDDPAFAAYVQHPRRFFRSVFPGISRGLDRILIRIFCLDPSKRVSLLELRNMVLACRSFSIDTPVAVAPTPTLITPPPSQQQQQMIYSDSLVNTMLTYIADFTDDSIPSSYQKQHQYYHNSSRPLTPP